MGKTNSWAYEQSRANIMNAVGILSAKIHCAKNPKYRDELIAVKKHLLYLCDVINEIHNVTPEVTTLTRVTVLDEPAKSTLGFIVSGEYAALDCERFNEQEVYKVYVAVPA